MPQAPRPVSLAASDGSLLSMRPLSAGDLEPLMKFANALVREKKANRELGVGAFDRRVTRKSESKFLGTMLHESERRQGVNLAAFSGASLVGLCSVRRREPVDFRHTGVLGIAVLEAFRGRGVGRGLMSGVLGSCLKSGIWLVELEVMAINGRAIRLYEGLGFRRVGTVPGKALRDGREIDLISMYADLRRTDKSPGARRGRS